MDQITLKRFWGKINILNNNDCWEWNAAKTIDGYGRFKIAGKNYSPHRLVYETFFCNIPDKMDICHKCDNPSCCNPNHLFLGTRSDNMKDCYTKGRSLHILKMEKLRGEETKQAKLTNEMVLEAKRLYSLGIRGEKLCSKFPVHKTNLYRAIRGVTYKMAV